MIVLGVLPLVVTDPGIRLRVQLPDGNPLRTTDPVGAEQVGWVITPTTGVAGNALMDTRKLSSSLQPEVDASKIHTVILVVIGPVITVPPAA